MPFTVIGTDGGLLQQPVRRSYLALAPGERVDTILDLRAVPLNTTLTLRSLEFPAQLFMPSMGMGMGRGMGMAASGLAQGAAFDILSLRVDQKVDVPFTLPTTLSSYDRAWQPPADVPARVVRIDWRMMQFFLDEIGRAHV